ncbi:MAG: efflux RND transporter permease subunit [Bacteroidetes bacterium]|nr:efflux RND transporter permease subunit [Bacteroidota bacterium]
MWLTSISIKRPLLILMAVLAIMMGGAVAYRAMAVDLWPNVKIPVIAVQVAYPGAGPREVESRVTKPIEDALASTPGLKKLSSTAGDGYSLSILEFDVGSDPDAVAQDVERRVNVVRASLPGDAKSPSVMKFSMSDEPIMVAGVSWDGNPDGVYQLVDGVIRPKLEAVPGVSSVQLWGGREREIQVRIDRGKLDARGISLSQVTGALSAANLSVPGGFVEDGDSQFSVRVYGLYQEIDQIGDLVLSVTPNGGVVRLGDVATVEDGFKKGTALSRIDGRDGIAILVQKQQTANTVSVSQGVQKAMKSLAPTLPAGVQYSVVIDNAEFVRQSLDGVQGSLSDAVLIVALVLLLFLHTWRSTLIVLISIPTSLVATFGVIWALGFSMNFMSMMGLSLTIGILVDDSIVILENIYRHMKLGESPWSAAVKGRAEIGAAAVAITLVDVVVYLPLAFSTGMTSQFFKEFSGAIVTATLFSLLMSFTLTPMLASRWLTAGDEERSPLAPVWRRWEAGYEALSRGYGRMLELALRLRWLVLFAGFLAFVSGIALVGLGAVGFEFMAQSDDGKFTTQIQMPAGTTLEATSRATQGLEKQIAALPEVDSLISIVGSSSAGKSTIYVNLKPLSQRTRSVNQVAADVRSMIAKIPGMKGQAGPSSMFGGGSAQPITVSIKGSDMAVLTKLAGQVEDIVRKTSGTVDVTNSAVAGAPEMRVEIDHAKLADLGLTTAQVASAVRTAIDGTVATELRRENEDKVDIRVLYATAAGSELTAIPDIPLTTPTGARVKLDQVAKLVPADGPAEITRTDRTRRVDVGAGLTGGRPSGDVAEDIKKAVNKLALPDGYKISLGGESEQQDDAFGSLGLALVFSVVLMYMLMVALFNSLTYPLVIMGAMPLASVGAIGALAITGDTLNIMSMVGMIMLMGLVTKNGILLVDYTNTLRTRGYSRLEALLEAGPTRLRPILMTTAAMVCAMLPVASKLGEGASTRAPMGIVVIGGLLTSTLLTLVVVPAGYTVMDDIQEWVAARFRRGTRTAHAAAAAQTGPVVAHQVNLGTGGFEKWTAEPVPVTVKVRTNHQINGSVLVVPAEAGIQGLHENRGRLDARFRGHDDP